jgi:NADPH2:quinone reductase
MKALCFERFGGPEVLAIREVPDPVPRPGHAVVRMQAIGLNFADVYRRRGNYHLAHALLESRRSSGKILLIP